MATPLLLVVERDEFVAKFPVALVLVYWMRPGINVGTDYGAFVFFAFVDGAEVSLVNPPYFYC